jgi:hypothetical protein
LTSCCCGSILLCDRADRPPATKEPVVKRTATTYQRTLRWSLGCAHDEQPGDNRRPAYLMNRFASRGSAVV